MMFELMALIGILTVFGGLLAMVYHLGKDVQSKSGKWKEISYNRVDGSICINFRDGSQVVSPPTGDTLKNFALEVAERMNAQ